MCVYGEGRCNYILMKEKLGVVISIDRLFGNRLGTESSGKAHPLCSPQS